MLSFYISPYNHSLTTYPYTTRHEPQKTHYGNSDNQIPTPTRNIRTHHTTSKASPYENPYLHP